MFLSMNWIKDFVDLSGLDEVALIHQFSLSTAEVENEIFFKGICLVFKKDPVRNARTYRATDDAGHELVLSVNNDEYIITRLSDNIRFYFHKILN